MITTITVDDTDAREAVVSMEGHVRRSQPEIMDKLGEATRTQMVRQLFRQGSVSTGTGHRSLQVRPDGRTSRNLTGRAYLVGLDQGTNPHEPERNHRLRFWAGDNGWTVDGIADHISRHGTDDHPFIKRSVDVSLIKFDGIALKELRKYTED